MNLVNVDILPPVDQSSLISEYLAADILFLHLNNHQAFLKVLPSKLFEYAATGKPILAGLNGYSKDFIKSEIDGCIVFNPGEVNDAIKKLDLLTIKKFPRSKFITKFKRENIMKKMAMDILTSFNDND